jgi:hypothetical protein
MFGGMASSVKLAAVLLVCASLYACGMLCAERTTADVASPDGRYHARVFLRRCGPKLAAPFVTIRPSESVPSRSDDVLLAGRSLGPIEANWEAARTLRLVLTKVTEAEAKEAVETAKDRWYDVSVQYYHRATDTGAVSRLR